MKKFIPALCLLLCSCGPAGMLASDPIDKVMVEGVSHDVQRMPGTQNSWAASPSNQWGGFIDPHDYYLNKKAIEKRTGCRVLTETVTNIGLRTTAEVECKAARKKS